MNIIYQLGVQWGDVGRKCLLTELFFISSLARSASSLPPSHSLSLSLVYTLHLYILKKKKKKRNLRLEQFPSRGDDVVVSVFIIVIIFPTARKIPPLGTISAVYQV